LQSVFELLYNHTTALPCRPVWCLVCILW